MALRYWMPDQVRHDWQNISSFLNYDTACLGVDPLFMEGTMKIFLYIISIFWIAMGTLLIIHTRKTREVYGKLIYKRNPKLLAIFPLAFGILFAVGAFYYKEMFGLVFILGVIGILKGAYLILGPAEQINRVMEWWYKEAGDGTIRLFGLIIFILGCAIFSYLM